MEGRSGWTLTTSDLRHKLSLESKAVCEQEIWQQALVNPKSQSVNLCKTSAPLRQKPCLLCGVSLDLERRSCTRQIEPGSAVAICLFGQVNLPRSKFSALWLHVTFYCRDLRSLESKLVAKRSTSDPIASFPRAVPSFLRRCNVYACTSG